MSNITLVIFLVIFVLLSSFFSMSEISFSNANKFKLKTAFEKNPKKVKVTYNLSEDFQGTISTILIGNNLVNIAASSTATVLFIRLFDETKGPTLATIFITLVVLIFGEILPKLIGSNYCNKLIYVLSRPLKIFEIIFRPLSKIVNKIIGKLTNLFVKENKEPTLTDTELMDIVDEMEENEEIDEDESDLIKNAIEFPDTNSYDIMTPRVDVIGFDINDSIDEFKENNSLLSRSLIVVYEDSLDNILGYVDNKDVLTKLILKEEFNIKDIMHEVLYVNETKKIADLLVEMKQGKYGIAVVVDEFGGTDGIITDEDILEELVGDIWDEKDKVEYPFKKLNSNTYLVDGDMNILDFFDEIEFDRDNFESEYSTIGGFISEKLEKVPESNDTITYENLVFKVLVADETYVSKVKVIVKK